MQSVFSDNHYKVSDSHINYFINYSLIIATAYFIGASSAVALVALDGAIGPNNDKQRSEILQQYIFKYKTHDCVVGDERRHAAPMQC